MIYKMVTSSGNHDLQGKTFVLDPNGNAVVRAVRKFFEFGDRLFGALLRGRRKLGFIAVIFIIGAVFCGAYSIKLGPFNNFDLRNYQYYTPYALLTGRYDFDYAPAMIQTFLNPVPFVPFYLVTTHLKPVLAGFVMGCMHGLVAGLLIMTAMTMFSYMAPIARVVLSLLCVVLGIYGPTFLTFVGGSSADHITSLFVLSGVYVLIRGIRLHGAPDMRESRLALLIGGFLIGIAAGLKLVCVVFLIGYGCAVIVTGRRFLPRLKAMGLYGIASVLGVLISRGHWMAFLWSRFGNPLFPFYNKIFKSPYFYDRNWADNRYIPKTFKSAVLLPFHFITDTTGAALSRNFRTIRYALVYGLLLLCFVIIVVGLLVSLRRRSLSKVRLLDRTAIFLLVFFVVSYVIWQAKFAIIRYAVPLELLAPIVIVLLIQILLPWNSLRLILTVVVFTSIVMVMKPLSVWRREWSSSYIEVAVPRFANPSETLVITADDRPPTSYLIPAFQPEIRFMGLYGTFSRPNPGQQHRAADEMVELIRSHKGPIYILAHKQRIRLTMENIRPYNIYIKSNNCLPIHTKHEPAGLCLWPAEIR